MTNALVEVGLISVSVVLGILGLPASVVAMMVGVSLAWWVFVHRARFASMFRAKALGGLGTLALALTLMVVGHIVAYVLGGAFRAIMGMT